MMRLQIPLILVVLCLTVLCVVTAVFLFQQQSQVSDILKENVNSRRASVDLEECLIDLAVLLEDHVDEVSALHGRLESLLVRLDEVADQPMEKELSRNLNSAYQEYRQTYVKLRTGDVEADEQRLRGISRFLNVKMITPCREFRLYNGRLIEDTTRNHERVLRELAWGLAGMAVTSAVAGIFAGYVLTRGLTQSIRRLQVQIRDVTGRLGREESAVVVTEEGQFSGLRADVLQLTDRIETILKELRQKELEVLRAEQLAAVGHLAAGVAHEIRNPLTSIKMLVQAGLESGSPNEVTREDLVVIESEIRRMESSLKMFLDFARPPKPNRRMLDLRTVVQEAAGLVRGKAARQHVEIRLALSDDPVMLRIDGEQVRQVLVNLLMNGVDAQPRGGVIDVRIMNSTGSTHAAVLSVRDAGSGISEEIRDRLFQPFATNKETGLGLGLVISRRIMQDHGGEIEGANVPQGGAEFRLIFPASDPVVPVV